MTAIVGLAHHGRVYIGGDSACTAAHQLTIRADPKVFRNGPYVIGFAGSFRMGQLLHHAFNPPAPPEHGIHRFMVVDFIGAIRECLRAGGWARRENEQEQGGDFLVGVAGRLFRIESDYQVAIPADGYDAIGCGDEPALGVLYATAGLPPRQRIRTALAAAEHHGSWVRSPWRIVATRP